MNAPAAIGPVHGRVDDKGRLAEADPPLLRLQEYAGGVRGGALAIPPLASLVRLARRLRITISRRVVAAFGDLDVDLWVSARPAGDGTDLTITAWQEIAAVQPPPGQEALRWRDFTRASADWIFETDSTLRVTQPPANMPGAMGQPVEALFRIISDSPGPSRMVRAARVGERFEEDDATFLLGPGIPVRIAGVPLSDPGGRFSGYQLLISRREVRGSHPAGDDPAPIDDAFGTQLGRAMRGPLDRIIANADHISGRDDGPVRSDYAAYAGDIAGAGRHLLALVNDLIDLQTIERSDFRPEIDTVDLADIAQRATGLLGVRAANHQVQIVSPPAGQPVMARGDFRRVLQVLINLLSNAIRHAPAGGVVQIHCEREGDIAAVIVSDSGDGIAVEHHERIFDRFERLGLRDGSGSGLGLYISRRLARAMGGDIGVDSAPGEGARFVFTLPAEG